MDERRRSPRFQEVITVEAVHEGTTYSGDSIDVSVGGMRLEVTTGASLVAGMKVTLKFRLPDLETAVEVQAQVRWVDRVDSRIAGVQFMQGLRAKEAWAINRLQG